MLTSVSVIIITGTTVIVITCECVIGNRLVFESKVFNDSVRNMQGRILRDDDSV